MSRGSWIKDEVKRVLNPLQGSQTLISLQSQLHQWGGYITLIDCHSDHPGLGCTSAKFMGLQATGIIHLPEAARDQYDVEQQTGHGLFLVRSLAMLKLLSRLFSSSKTAGIDYEWL